MAGEEGESEINRMKGNVKIGNDGICVCADLAADADAIISFPSHFWRFAKMTLMRKSWCYGLRRRRDYKDKHFYIRALVQNEKGNDGVCVCENSGTPY